MIVFPLGEWKRSRELRRALTVVVMSSLFVLTSVRAAPSRELDQKIFNTYVGAAFADTGLLIKFARIPSVSAYCVNSACQPLLKKLDAVLDGALMVKRMDLEDSGADVEILFYPTTNERLQSKNQYTTGTGEVLGKSLHENCSVVQSRRGSEVTKVIIGVIQDAGPRENLLCIMSELLRGMGVTVKGHYQNISSRIWIWMRPSSQTLLEGLRYLRPCMSLRQQAQDKIKRLLRPN